MIKTLVLLISLLLATNAWGDIKRIVCEQYAVKERKGFEIGDVDTINTFTFDTDDFENANKVASWELNLLWANFTHRIDAPYTVSPEWITFNYQDDIPHTINRKTLTYRLNKKGARPGATTPMQPYKCVLEDVDNSDNLF